MEEVLSQYKATMMELQGLLGPEHDTYMYEEGAVGALTCSLNNMHDYFVHVAARVTLPSPSTCSPSSTKASLNHNQLEVRITCRTCGRLPPVLVFLRRRLNSCMIMFNGQRMLTFSACGRCVPPRPLGGLQGILPSVPFRAGISHPMLLVFHLSYWPDRSWMRLRLPLPQAGNMRDPFEEAELKEIAKEKVRTRTFPHLVTSFSSHLFFSVCIGIQLDPSPGSPWALQHSTARILVSVPFHFINALPPPLNFLLTTSKIGWMEIPKRLLSSLRRSPLFILRYCQK